MIIPQNITSFISQVKKTYPHLLYSLNEPYKPTGNWWLRLKYAEQDLPVTYKENHGFGFYDMDDVDFGSFPEVVIADAQEAKAYLFAHYGAQPTRKSTQPVLAMMA